MRRPARLWTGLFLAAGMVALSVAVIQPAAAASTLGLDKEASVSSTTPGADFTYTLTPRCSGLTEACINAVVTDVLPPQIQITDLPQSNSERTITFDAVTRTLTIKFTIALPAPSPAGSVGLPAGSSRTIQLGVKVPDDTTAADGTVITNVANATSDNTSPATGTAEVTLDVPRVVRPVATKVWSDGSAVAGSDEAGSIALNVRNGSSSTARVSELSVTDAAPATFDRFDVTGIGPVTFPPGADQVTVSACTAVLSACTDAQYVSSAPQAGPALALPPGIAAGTVTGLRFVFSAADGSPLPASPNSGSVAIGTKLRNTLRSTGATYSPATRDDVVNCATPTGVDPVLGAVSGAPACDTYSVQPAQVTIAAGKTYFSDTNGDYIPDGQAVFGQDSLVSARITARNTSPFPVATVTITEPSSFSPSEFSKLDVTSMRVVFPSGATQATVSVTCTGGAVIRTDLLPPPATVNVPVTCAAGTPTAITSTFTGRDPDGAGTIASDATAELGVQGRLNASVAPDDIVGGSSAGVSDCADAAATSSIDGVGAAAATACASVDLQPAFARLAGVKSSTLPTILPGLPRDFSLSFTNRGTIAATGVTLADPIDPSAADNPFKSLRLASLTMPATPAATTELWDPDVARYVPYVATDTALLARALGFRVQLTGPIASGQRYALGARVLLRDGIPLGARIQNCAGVGSDTQPIDPASSFCAPFSTVTAQSSGASLQKAISPATSVRPQPGLPGQTIQVKFAAQNTGTLWLKRLQILDTDTAFFDAVDVTGTIRVNYPPIANRVQVDACTGACTDADFVNGTPSQTAKLPVGIAAADVRGLRFTFTAVGTGVAGDFAIRPGTNFPTTGACTAASVCVDVVPRAALHSDPGAATPNTLSDTATGGFESTQQGGNLAPIGDTAATHTLTTGTARLQFAKTSDIAAGPGDPIPFTLSTTNTGTGPIPDPVVVDPLPAQLEFNPADPTQPYSITYTLPTGAPAPPTVLFDPQLDAQGTVTALKWSFPGWNLVPGAVIAISFQTVLAPGISAGTTIQNRAGGSGARADLACESGAPRPGQETDNPVYGAGRFCTSASQVRTLAGDAIRTEKWVAGDPTLGWLNSLTLDPVPLGDPACPRLTVDGQLFTRYPCVARVVPGQGFDFYLRVVNAGTNLATAVRLVDVLPAPGDTGVILTGDQRGTQWNPAPTLLKPVTLAVGDPGNLTVDYTAAGPYCTTDLNRPSTACPAAAWADPYSADETAFRAVLTFGAGLPPGGSAALTFRMRAPAAPVNTSTDEIAWNSFAHTEFFSDSGRTVQLPPTEPIKTGVALVFGGLTIHKVIGAGVPADAGPFQMAYACTVTPETPTGQPADPVTAASGTFQLAADQSLTLTALPARGICKIWETDPAGLISDANGEAHAKTVQIPIEGTTDLPVVTITNTMPIAEPPPTTPTAPTTPITPTTPTIPTTVTATATPTTPTTGTTGTTPTSGTAPTTTPPAAHPTTASTPSVRLDPTTSSAATTPAAANKTTTTATTPEGTIGSPFAEPPPPGSAGGQLPNTGTPAAGLTGLGAATVLAGLILVFAAKRRRQTH